MPLNDICKKMEGTFTFKPPTKVQTIGAFLTNTNIKTKKVSVDVLIEMPSDYFTERDYLNYRYFIKRNLYMSHVCHQLINAKLNYNLSYNFVSNYSSSFKPLLCLTIEGMNKITLNNNL